MVVKFLARVAVELAFIRNESGLAVNIGEQDIADASQSWHASHGKRGLAGLWGSTRATIFMLVAMALLVALGALGRIAVVGSSDCTARHGRPWGLCRCPSWPHECDGT